MKKERITTAAVRIPPKMYSQAVRYGDVVYVSGQLGRHPDGHLDVGDARAQVRQAFQNVKNILEAAGSSMENIITCQCHLRHGEDLDVLNDVYRELFQEMEVPPARWAVVSPLVLPEALFEVIVTGAVEGREGAE